ncbi:hypothetical protein KY362_04950, partial [Candidatus Woesearchaeota archaeon]|nr:hypothetical protein [Candidatus Woesearchaeota archaeon]
IPDWVKNDVNGYVVPPFNPRSMADAISRLLDSNKRLEKLGKAAYATAKEHDLKKVILQVEDMYLSLVK